MTVTSPSLILDVYLSALSTPPSTASTSPALHHLLHTFVLPLLARVDPPAAHALSALLSTLSNPHAHPRPHPHPGRRGNHPPDPAVADGLLLAHLRAKVFPLLDAPTVPPPDRRTLLDGLLAHFRPSTAAAHTPLGPTITLLQQNVSRFEDRYAALHRPAAPQVQDAIMASLTRDIQEWLQALWAIAHNKRASHLDIVRRSLLALTRMHDALSYAFRRMYTAHWRTTTIRTALLDPLLASPNLEHALLWVWRDVLVLSALPSASPHAQNPIYHTHPHPPAHSHPHPHLYPHNPAHAPPHTMPTTPKLTRRILRTLGPARVAAVLDGLPSPAPSYPNPGNPARPSPWVLVRGHWGADMAQAAREVWVVGRTVLEEF